MAGRSSYALPPPPGQELDKSFIPWNQDRVNELEHFRGVEFPDPKTWAGTEKALQDVQDKLTQ